MMMPKDSTRSSTHHPRPDNVSRVVFLYLNTHAMRQKMNLARRGFLVGVVSLLIIILPPLSGFIRKGTVGCIKASHPLQHSAQHP